MIVHEIQPHGKAMELLNSKINNCATINIQESDPEEDENTNYLAKTYCEEELINCK